MERTPLNKAHEVGRRAVNCVRRGQLREAVECHLTAAKILHDLEATLGKESGCKRSLEEQATFHERQATLAQVLREVFEKSLAQEKMTDKMVIGERKRVLRPLSGNSNPPTRIPSFTHPNEIFRQIDEVDSLLQILYNRKGITAPITLMGDIPEGHHLEGDPGVEEATRALDFTIRPRNDSEVIEELQVVNSNLRGLVDKLLTELNESKEENRELRRRLAEYENDTQSAVTKRGRQKFVVGEKMTPFKPTSSMEVSDVHDLPELGEFNENEFNEA